MKGIIGFSIRNGPFVNVLMVILIGLGLFAFSSIPRDENPDINFNWIIIVTSYPGVSASDIETLLTKPIEDVLQTIEDIDFVSSTSYEGMSDIMIRFKQGLAEDAFDKRVQELRREVVNLDDLPGEAKDPVVLELTTSNFLPVLNVLISGEISERELKDLGKDLKDKIEINVEGLSKITFMGVRDREIWVEVDPERMEGYGLTLREISGALAARSLNVPCGKLETGRSEYLIRTQGEFQKPEEIGKVIVRSNALGEQVAVSDFARVSDTFEEATQIVRMSGKQSVELNIFKTPRGNAIKIIDEMKEVIGEWKQDIPPEVEISMANDLSARIRTTLSMLTRNAAFGMGLVVLLLFLFLGFRNALFAGLGIPVTLLTSLFVLYFMGYTLNSPVMVGMGLVLGLIVDDAIIIIENVYRYLQRGMAPKEAAYVGTQEVIVPVLSAMASTVCAFMPLLFLGGIVGEFMRLIPITVMIALLASLFEAVIILPSHLADWQKKMEKNEKRELLHGLMECLRSWYTWVIVRLLRWRWLTLIGATVVITMSFFLLSLVGMDLFSDDPISQFSVRIITPYGAKLETTNAIVSRFEEEALKLPDEEVEQIITRTGVLYLDTEMKFGPNYGEVLVDLVERGDRERTIYEIMEELEERTKHISGTHSVEIAGLAAGPPAGRDVEVKVRGKYFDTIMEIVTELKDYLSTIDGVSNINDDFNKGKEELRVYIKEEKAAVLGVDMALISSTLRSAIDGYEAAVLRDGDEEVDIIVKYQAEKKDSIEKIRELKIPSKKGALIPLKDVCDFSIGRGIAEIKRFDFERTITVTADVNSEIATAVDVNKLLQKRFEDISSRYIGYNLDFRGVYDEFKKSFDRLGQLLLVGVVVIYAILVLQFKSLIQPMIIMMTIPFSFVGVIVGLLISGNPFSIFSMYGIIALSGIVVNDSLIMIDFTNRARMSGVGKNRAIIDSGRLRLRPIILTTVTTIGGLLPLAIGVGGKSLMWGPLANTIVWGLAAATMLALFIVPVLYSIVDDVSRLLGLDRFRTR